MQMHTILLILVVVGVIWAGLAALAAWVAQLIILSLTERRLRFLRWAPLATPALALCCGILNISVTWLGAAGALLVGWGLAWGVYKFQKRRESP